MTPQALQELVAKGDLNPLADALAPLTETERRKLSTTAYQLYRAYKVSMEDARFTPFHLSIAARRAHADTVCKRAAAVLAMLGVSPWSRVKSIHVWWSHKIGPSPLLSVLGHRRPEWANEWLTRNIEQDDGISWPMIRALIHMGICDKPSSESYIRLFVLEYSRVWAQQPGAVTRTPAQPLSQRLGAEPDVLEDEIWQLFEIETDAFTSDRYENSPYMPSIYEAWPTALKTLADRGQIDRQRLLDASLQALTSGFGSRLLSAFCQFHARFEPTIAEMSACETAYRQLLGHPEGHVVTFALRMLQALEKAEGLQAEPFLVQVATVFALPTKRQATLAMQVIKRVVKRCPECREQAIEAGMQALRHPSSDIHDLALNWLEKYLGRGALQERRAQAYLISAGSEAQATRVSPASEQSVRTDEIWCSGGEHICQPRQNVLEVDLLTGLHSLEPITQVEELIDAVSHAIEAVDGPDDIERILDGLSRLCDQRDSHFELRTAALVHRLEQPQTSERGLLAVMHPVAPAWRDLLLAWLRPEVAPEPWRATYGWTCRSAAFIEARLVELTARVSRRQASPLLAAPTHPHGWIDAVALVERVRPVQSAPINPCWMMDMIQALLRLAPDRRPEALKQAAGLQGPWRTILCWALGGTDRPMPRDDIHQALWIAAGRARCPRASLAADLAGLGIVAKGPDGIEPAQYDWQAKAMRERYRGGRLSRSGIHIAVTPSAELRGRRELPTTALHDRSMSRAWGWERAPFIHWMAMIWPLNPDSMHAMAVPLMMDSIESGSSSTSEIAAYLDTLFVPHRPWSEMGVLMLGVALLCKQADVRGLAVDALIEGIEDGRARPQPLVDVLTRLAAGEWIKLNRLASALGESARVSARHHRVVAEIIQGFLTRVPTWPRHSHQLLEMLLASLHALGRTLSEPMRAVLQSVEGATQSARLARRLLDLPQADRGEQPAPHARQVLG